MSRDTRFLAGNPEPPPQAHPAVGPGQSGKRERILIVDDDVGMRRMLSRLLAPLGHEVLSAENAEAAFAIATREPVDLVISDLVMPDMDGITLLRRLREQGLDAAFILLTAFGELDTVLSARDRYELSNFFVKPILSQDKFLFDVITALRKRSLELENRRLIDALAKANQGLEQKVAERTQELSEKNAELTRLSNFRAEVLKVLSHELRTPMAILKGYLGLAGAERDPLHSKRVMHSAVERVQEIVDQAIDLKRGAEPASFQLSLGEVTPGALCAGAMARIQPLVDFRRIVILLEAEPVPACDWDAARIASVVEELLINAVRASRDGETVRVYVRASGETVEIAVSDEGVEIPECDRRRIFEPFVTLGSAERHRSGQFTFRAQGAGLGLAVAKLWVDLHQGQLCVHANQGRPGTTFLLRLPRDPRREQEAEPMAAS